MKLELAAELALIAAGLLFLWGLLLGVWKFAAISASSDGHAHLYVDIAHRAALMYSFATLLLAALVQFNAWPSWLTVAALAVVVAFFAGAIAAYCLHGWRRDTENQYHPAGRALTAATIALIVGEVGGTLVIFSGFLAHVLHGWAA
ncbi:MAG: hypothetical protein WAW85_04800 [Gordonia sp. (in: high G+C Gram-positive bacteria)]|uniref:hypothetical protein n=1 Tax=Gordonia sp. (in: high G+C Gram-positive bacteria) TaxID=84139 RepID=UPI003BB73BDC